MSASVLLLDLDGTLVDSNAAHARAFARAAAEFGIPIARDRFDRVIGKGADHVVPDVFGTSFERDRGDAFRDALGRHFHQIAREESLAVFDGAERLAEAARRRGLSVALATSSSEDDLDALFASAGVDFRDRVDYVTTSSDVDGSKPEPDLVRVVAEHFGVPAAGCVLVGDTVYDGQAARRGGAAFVGVTTWTWSQEDLEGAGARAVYPSVAALADDFDAALDAAQPGQAALTADAADALMAEALDQARAALDAGDAPIGAVIGRADGTVLARGRNRATTAGDRLRHAETDALHTLMAGPGADDGLVLATTLEPCSMCLGAMTEAGIHATIYALEAPPNGARGALDPLPGRRQPLVAAWDRGHRSASLDLVRQGARAQGGFMQRLLDAIRDQ
ncbi:HAD-IA family hydrolase [Rubrivirga sp.]|uniref:HAD-IA family hydrolase n=1 Tax=Rubrivirga sp. TaxID=1885344 RepID=UPI003B5302E4